MRLTLRLLVGSVVASSLLGGLVGALVVAALMSKARSTADDVARAHVLRDLTMALQRVADERYSQVSRDARVAELKGIVEQPRSRAELSTGEVLRYELVWNGEPIPSAALETTVLVREAARSHDGRRAVAFADGRVVFLDR